MIFSISLNRNLDVTGEADVGQRKANRPSITSRTVNLGGTTGIFLPSHLWTGGFCLYLCHCEGCVLPPEAISLNV